MEMTTVWISRLLVRELEGFSRELALFPDDQSIWKKVPGVNNSAANLALHVAGNLQYFIGAVLGGTGYKRNRDAEFQRQDGTRQEVLAELEKAARTVEQVLSTLPQSRLLEPFPEAVMQMQMICGQFLLHLCAHAGFHLGQAGYLRRALTQDARSSGPLPLKPLLF